MKFPAIKEHHLYNKAYRQGKHFFGRYICVYVLKDTHARLLQKSHPQRLIVNRFGISVSKKVGTAVKRNRAKRVIRAAYAPIEDVLLKGYLKSSGCSQSAEGQKNEARLYRAYSLLQEIFVATQIAALL